MTLIMIFIGAYLLGSIPFGLVLTKAAGLSDIRTIGSGNIGATNVLRTGRKDLALATLLLDSGKGAIAVLLAAVIVSGAPEWPKAFAAAGAFLGHCFPIYLGFKGGKGVATFIGTLIALSPLIGAISCLIWLAVAYFTRYSSLSALVMAGLAPILLLIAGQAAFFLAASFMTALIIYRHLDNILRLLEGTESKIGQKSSDADAAS